MFNPINRSPIDSVLKACIFFIVYRERNATSSLGEEKRLSKSGSLFYQNIIKISSKIGFIGIVFLYIVNSFKNKKVTITSLRNKIIISDHKNKIIVSKILKQCDSIDIGKSACLGIYVPKVKFFNFKVFKRLFETYKFVKPISSVELNALVNFWHNFVIFTFCFKKSNFKSILLVDDLSPLRLALCYAAKLNNIKIGIVRMISDFNRFPPPFVFDILFCWNKIQAEKIKDNVSFVSHIPRSISNIKFINITDSKFISIGVALNINSEKNKIIKYIDEIKSRNSSINIYLRPHPRADWNNWCLGIEGLNTCYSEESIDKYLINLDLVICGNTSLIKEILYHGVPVVYSDKLDQNPFDNYGYVSDGIVYYNESFEIDIQKINKFYSNSGWKMKLKKEIEPYPGSIPIAKAITYLFT